MRVTILILIDGFLQLKYYGHDDTMCGVTILILIDGFLQSELTGEEYLLDKCHNPYFNRWFSAI